MGKQSAWAEWTALYSILVDNLTTLWPISGPENGKNASPHEASLIHAHFIGVVWNEIQKRFICTINILDMLHLRRKSIGWDVMEIW